MDSEKLLRLSVECYKSLRPKYSARVRWTPEFEAWRRFLEDQVGVRALEVPRKLFLEPSPRER